MKAGNDYSSKVGSVGSIYVLLGPTKITHLVQDEYSPSKEHPWLFELEVKLSEN